ncbi:PREDICTED: uncharacterized protein LOC104738490 [Camelina sativa]|uniref:Uncharacterized protein LOC104738490 n=1 Tax=Camelina sativa TaxID=90675 RepID=A0ABM0VJ01_CAMSA|nr:PREDICTED: uncharacterized protein LOC104738490 [Camelina sativa]
MKLFVETQSSSSFEIEVDHKDTLSEVLQDDLDIEQCQIFHESRLQLLVSPDHNQTEQSPPPSNSTKEQIIDGHDQDVTTVTVQNDQSPLTNATESVINPHQDSTVPTQVPQTEQSPSSNSVEEMITNIQDLSAKERIRNKRIVLYVFPYSGESKAAKEIPVAVSVKKNDNVKELRNELVKIEERGELILPEEGYFLIHKNRVLNENLSFWVVGVDHEDTIRILPTHLTRGSFNLDS